MILAAGALVLLGLGLFVAGIVTDITLFYWLCVGACVVAGVLLVVARLRIGRVSGSPPPPPAPAPAVTPPPPAASTSPGVSAPATRQFPASGGTAARAPDAAPLTDPAPATGTAAAAGTDAEEPSSAAHAPRGARAAGELPTGDPAVEEVEVTDLLLVVDLHDEVLVVDEHPRYHLAGCPWLAGRTTVPLPIDEARTDGFTPCALCSPDRTLAERERARRG